MSGPARRGARPAELMLTAFGLGHLWPAPGTWGSLPPPALALLLAWWPGPAAAAGRLIDAALVLLGLIFALACVAWGSGAEARYGRKDPGQVVADEVAGQSIALLALPWRAMIDAAGGIDLAAARWNVAMAATAFLAFRFFDILKPPPARGLERLAGGWGILIDDLFAGAYALAATQAIVRLALPHVL